MDFFQGSSPPNFISFCLVNQIEDESQMQSNNTSNIPGESTPTSVSVDESHVILGTPPTPAPACPTSLVGPVNTIGETAQEPTLTSPPSVESETDVNAFAETMVKHIESQQARDALVGSPAGPNFRRKDRRVEPRASTPIIPGDETITDISLNNLESGLQVATTSRTTLQELLPSSSAQPGKTVLSDVTTSDEKKTSICDVPALPEGVQRVRFLDYQDDSDSNTEVTRQHCPELYSHIPFGSGPGTEGGDESGLESQLSHRNAPSTSAARRVDDSLPELSGRSRALLKSYFTEAKTFNLPHGHPAVVFSESQMYHLLRIMSDETLRMSYTTMERMVIDAVKGMPTSAPSRTEHFRSRTRASTPFRVAESDSSDAESTDMSKSKHTETNSSDENATFEDSDSAGELALIASTFQKSNITAQQTSQQSITPLTSPLQNPESAEYSSQDATLREVRDQTLEEQSQRFPQGKMAKSKGRRIQRGVPMREEFFSKIGWTRSFISGPADPLHNPHMVWCHICKRNISIKSKGVMEILRHHRTEKHLRKDQKWRYTHLKSVVPVSNKPQHRVRGRNGKLLNRSELAKELPKFIHAELVDIGERFPFYEDFFKGRTTPMITPESRAKTQLCIVADFIRTQGDLSLLRNLWSRISSFTDHQASLCDFDWGEEHLTVSFIPVL